jgi:hypothetical protein
MISRVLLRRTLVLPILAVALAACSDDDERGTGPGSFTLGTPANAAVTLVAGQATTVTIPVTFTGSMKAVTLTADSVPAGVRVGFQPSTITNGTEQVTVSITANPDAFIGTRTIKIIAKAADMQDQVARIAVTTTAPGSYTATNNTSTASPVTIKRGQSGTITVTLVRNGFTGPVDIIADALPTGVSIVPVTNVTGNTATITINTTAAAAQTTGASFTIRATNPTIADRPMTVRYAITPEYTLSSNAGTAATAVQIQRTQSGTATININRDTYQGPVTLTASSLPTGITVATVPNVAGNTATITITTADNAVADTGSFVITGTADGLQNQTTRVRYRVLAEPGVQLTAPNVSTPQGNHPTITVGIAREGGFTGPVTVALSGLPAGVTTNGPITSDSASATFTLFVPNNQATGATTYTATASGTGIATRSKTGTLTVTAATGTLLTSGVQVNVPAGAADTQTLYRIAIPAGATRLTVVLTGGTGDIDLVGRAGIPSVYANGGFEDISAAAGNEEDFVRNNPPEGYYYILAYNYDASSGAKLTATVTGGAAISLQPEKVTIPADKAARLRRNATR